MDKYTGKRLDSRYEIQKLIGVGGMAVVYRAYDIIEDKVVALKILKDEFLGNEEFIRRFKNESKAIAVLSHPNIVKVFDVSLGTKIQYIVMEYIDGIALKEYLYQQKTIDWKDAIHFIKQILSALKHAHDKGIVHRDIKPQNIMLLKSGEIKVTDFGIAQFSSNETKTMADSAIGSVHYISPEQAKGNPIDEKSDIYSVGVMLYEMLTGKLPFEADNAVSVAIMQMQTKPKMPREINPEIPKGLEEITLHAMEKIPAQRYATTDEMLEDIEKFQSDPSSRFEYEYFVDDNPTKYVNAINSVKINQSDYDDTDDRKNKNRAGMIAGGIVSGVVLIALVFILIYMFTSCGSGSKDVDVPNFINMKLSDVQNNPEYKFNFKVEPVYDATKPEGYIIEQEPPPGSKKVKENSIILLKVNSAGVLISVPAVRGLTEEIAKKKILDAGLKSETLMIVDEQTPSGIVMGVDPQEETKVTADTTVKLYVSKGPAEEKVKVPDIIGKSLIAAKNEIVSVGLKVSDNIIKEASDKPENIVLSSDPLPGVSVGKGGSVKLTVSSGVKKEKPEKTVKISAEMPSGIGTVNVEVFVDSISKKTDRFNTNTGTAYSFELKGTTGKKMVNIEINDQDYAAYEVDFDSGNSKLIYNRKNDFKNEFELG